MTEEVIAKKACVFLIEQVLTDQEGQQTKVLGVDIDSLKTVKEKIDQLNKKEKDKKKSLVDFIIEKIEEFVKLIETNKSFLDEFNNVDHFCLDSIGNYFKDNFRLDSFNLNLPNLIENYNLDAQIGIKFYYLLGYLKSEGNVVRELHRLLTDYGGYYTEYYFNDISHKQKCEGRIDYRAYIEYWVDKEFYEYFCTYKFTQIEFVNYELL